jgi:hypothetical protein
MKHVAKWLFFAHDMLDQEYQRVMSSAKKTLILQLVA